MQPVANGHYTLLNTWDPERYEMASYHHIYRLPAKGKANLPPHKRFSALPKTDYTTSDQDCAILHGNDKYPWLHSVHAHPD